MSHTTAQGGRLKNVPATERKLPVKWCLFEASWDTLVSSVIDVFVWNTIPEHERHFPFSIKEKILNIF